jgi:hypothetical protein
LIAVSVKPERIAGSARNEGRIANQGSVIGVSGIICVSVGSVPSYFVV